MAAIARTLQGINETQKQAADLPTKVSSTALTLKKIIAYIEILSGRRFETNRIPGIICSIKI